MKLYTGWQYLLIDVANNFIGDLDKLRFEDRIAWAEDSLHQLEDLGEDLGHWKKKPLFLKAVQAVRKAQRGEATGHMVGLDAVCSGMQLMSVLTGCEAGAAATGLVDPDRRADAYSECTDLMTKILGFSTGVNRDDVKQGVMTSLYGSKAEPKKVFGEDTPELTAFYQAMYQLAPGPCVLLQTLLDSWNPGALSHEWKLPDGFDAKVKVMQRMEKRIEVDELDHATFTYTYFVNQGERKGVKNAANVIHSIDAYVLRSLVRRCNYDWEAFTAAQEAIEIELMERSFGELTERSGVLSYKEQYYIEQYQRSTVADVVIIPHLTYSGIRAMTTVHLQKLNSIVASMLVHQPFPVVTIHDDFHAHPNNLNHVRMHYRDILAELADSRVLDDVLGQLYGYDSTFPKLSSDLSDKIRNSNYALC